MNHMCHMQNSAQSTMPDWLLYSMAALFFAGACFYLYRLVRPKVVQAAYGYYDWENEIGHGLCMLAMSAALAPAFMQPPAMFWTVVLSLGGAWFFLRALTWGRKLAHNKWWYDWGHVGMLFGMALMFANISGRVVVLIAGAFWLWFSLYNTYQTWIDRRSGNVLCIGSNLCHLTMGVVMFAMTTAPSLFMGNTAT